MKLVCIESPLSGDFTRNVDYARKALRYVLSLGYAPFASHLLYTQVLDDREPEHRKQGIEAGLALGDACHERWFFDDYGFSVGMSAAYARAQSADQPVRIVKILQDPKATTDIEPTPGLAQIQPEQITRLREIVGSMEDATVWVQALTPYWHELHALANDIEGTANRA